MAKRTSLYVCQQCGASFSKWSGKCDNCGAWNSLIEEAKQLEKNGYPILRGPRKTGDGYYEFETLDPDNNRLEVTTRFVE